MNARNKYSSIIPILILMILLVGCVKTGEQNVKPGKIPVKEGEFCVSDIYGNVERKDISKINVKDAPIYIFKSEKIMKRLEKLHIK